VGFGLLTGFCFSLNSLVINYLIVKVNFPSDQLCFDGNLLYGLSLLPLFIYEQVVNDTFKMRDIILINAQQTILLMGIFSFIFALKYGDACSA